MRHLFQLIRNNLFFLLPLLLILALAGGSILTFSKTDIHLAMNHHYSDVEDLLMPWITWIGDGWVITILVLLLFALNRPFAFFTGISCLLASGVTQLLKHTLYYGLGRPANVLSGTPLRFVPGVEQHYFDTFPSGHTTLAFAFFFALSIGARSNYLKVLSLLLAVLVGYSRIYLSQHFLEDTFAGALIGTGMTLLIFATAIAFGKVKLPVPSPGK